MRAVIVYESMFGNTRQVAQAVARGMQEWAEVTVVPVAGASTSVLEGADLVVVGGPTHAWGMSRPNTRRGAPAYARDPGSGLVVEPGADTGPGVREWLAGPLPAGVDVAAFDTKMKGPALLTGRASRGMARRLRRHRMRMIARPESFLVTRRNHLMPGELDRAGRWGHRLVATRSVSGSARA